MRVNVYVYPIIALVVFLGIIQLSTLTPYWDTANRGLPSLAAGPAPESAGEVALVDTAEIKGSWSLADAATTFEVPASEIRSHFGIPADVPETTALKDLAQSAPGFETSLLREWLKERSPVAKK